MRPRSSRQLSTTGGCVPVVVSGCGETRLRPATVPSSAARGRGDVLGRDAAAAADDLRALLAPLERERRVRLRVDPLVEAPEVAREVTEVRIDAERQLREVAEPADHAGHVIDGQAVDEQGADAHLLEAACGPAEEVALRRPPVLTVDAADAVTAAAERDPDGEAELEELLDEGRTSRARGSARASRAGSGRAARRRRSSRAGSSCRCGRATRRPPRARTRPRAVARPPTPRFARAGCRCARCPSSAAGRHPRARRPVSRRARTTCWSRRRRSPRRRTSDGRRAPLPERGRAPSCPRGRPSLRGRRDGRPAGARSRCRRRG